MQNRKRTASINSHTKTGLLSRLRTIEGHVRGILRMVEADAYCPDVLTQALAVERAMDWFVFELLEHHLESCFVTAVRGGSVEDRERAIREVLGVFQASTRLKGRRLLEVPEGNGDPSGTPHPELPQFEGRQLS